MWCAGDETLEKSIPMVLWWWGQVLNEVSWSQGLGRQVGDGPCLHWLLSSSVCGVS